MTRREEVTSWEGLSKAEVSENSVVSCCESSVKREEDVNPYHSRALRCPHDVCWAIAGTVFGSNSMLPTLTEPLWCEGAMLIGETKLLHYLTVGR